MERLHDHQQYRLRTRTGEVTVQALFDEATCEWYLVEVAGNRRFAVTSDGTVVPVPCGSVGGSDQPRCIDRASILRNQAGTLYDLAEIALP